MGGPRPAPALAEAGSLAESGWLSIVKAHIALYADHDPPQARRHAQDAVAIGQAIGSRDIEMLALAYEGLAQVSDGLVAEGMGKLDESATAAISGELRGVDEAGTIACCLISACERVRDVGRAAEWCLRLRELSERWAFELMIAICRTHYASTLVARGQWPEAEREFQAAITGFGHPHRGQAAEAQVRLAELRVRQGRRDEAEELLSRVDAGPARMLGHKIALAVRAAILLENGDAQRAVDTAEVYLRAIAGPESLDRARRRAGSEGGPAGCCRPVRPGGRPLRALPSMVRRARDLLADLGGAEAGEAAPFAGLTRREAEILWQVARGSANQDIAADLVISAADLDKQDSHGVKYLRYWVDEGAGRIFCLVEAPDADAAHTVHREAHGLVADETFKVSEGV